MHMLMMMMMMRDSSVCVSFGIIMAQRGSNDMMSKVS